MQESSWALAGIPKDLEPYIKRDWRPTGSRILPPDVAALLDGRGGALCYPKYFFHAEAKALLDPAYQKAIQQSEASVDDTLRAVTADVNERMRQLAATAR